MANVSPLYLEAPVQLLQADVVQCVRDLGCREGIETADSNLVLGRAKYLL